MAATINGVDYVYLGNPVWSNQDGGSILSGGARHLTQRELTLSGSTLTMDEFNQIDALKGQKVSIEICGYNVNDKVPYYDCTIQTVTGTQEYLNMNGVRVVIKVGQV